MTITQTKAREALGSFLIAYRSRKKAKAYFGRRCFRK
jgi:hypothetical protein